MLYGKLDGQNLEVDVLNILELESYEFLWNWQLVPAGEMGSHCLRPKQQLPQPLDARAIILWHTAVRSMALSHGLPLLL